MKLRLTTLVITLALFLTACNFTLAADVTPPPDYVPPTPMPTMGPLFPATAPDVNNGARIYTEKCMPCHGSTGLGDGEKGIQLPVPVAPIGLPDFAVNAIPSAWYTQVTKGNIDRFMPPFASLSDQERWDVVSYALTLHIDPAQSEKGKALFEKSCADCAKYFSSPEEMYALSETALIHTIKNGKDEIPAFGKNLTDEEISAVAVYLRTLTFAATAAEPTATAIVEPTATLESGTGTPAAAEATPADGTQTAPTEGTQSATPAGAMGSVSGKVDNKTGKNLPAGTKITLHGYEHGGDPSAGPTEVVVLDGTLNADGTYSFENVELPENRIYLSEIKVDGITYKSEFEVAAAGMTKVDLKPIIMYATTEDFSALKVTSLQVFFDFATQGEAKIFVVYSILNDSDKTIMVTMSKDQAIPFVAFPEGASNFGYEATQDSAPFTQTEKGFSMVPSKTPYGLIAFSSIQKTKETAVSQPVLLAVDEVTLFLPEGMEANSEAFTDEGIQPMQSMNFHVYKLGKVKKGATIDFTISGDPAAATEVNPDITQNKNLLIGIGAFGIVLILLGGWLFIRDRGKVEDDEDDEDDDDEFEDAESNMDAIIALDDLHRAGKISDEAYQKRREELKDALKRK